ncbi:hypothetical protein PoB_000939100 [Plakobranchus ocellatus]|uniref:Uncharacterized protein n=1 Tax=Plakobranchus ocellatus TaxID=259542 RepID=A0AAV3YKH5_9GAST|nr:hypothetical protein PoB_000939100 [Plakobranchus ocellatus]
MRILGAHWRAMEMDIERLLEMSNRISLGRLCRLAVPVPPSYQHSSTVTALFANALQTSPIRPISETVSNISFPQELNLYVER